MAKKKQPVETALIKTPDDAGALSYIGAISRSISSESNQEQLTSAFGIWVCYPVLKELMVEGNPNDSIRFELDKLHERAVLALMNSASSKGLDATRIFLSGFYCRDLLSHSWRTHYSRGRRSDFWPDCLGSSMYSLPEDVRNAILVGHAEVHHLNNLLSTRPLDSAGVVAEDLMTAQEIAALVGCERKSLTRYEKEWEKIITRGNQPHLISYAKNLPTFRAQFDHLTFPETPPKRPVKCLLNSK